MAHLAQYEFAKRVLDANPWAKEGQDVLCVGSLDINSTSRGMRIDLLFAGAGGSHTGLDLGPGPGVDIVCSGHLFDPGRQYDIVYSCECFEHNRHWAETLQNMVRLCRRGGLLFFTCATKGRKEHGTTRTNPKDSPFTTDYYRNLTEADVMEALPGFLDAFASHEFSVHAGHKDLQFWGHVK